MTLARFRSAPLPALAARPGGEARAVHLVSFGCQMNKYDSELVEGRFRARGWRVTGRIADADLVLFNTCSVREHAEQRVYSWLGELRREKARRPELLIGVMGCMAERAEDEIFGRAAHVDLVVGTRRFQHLPELVEELAERRARAAPGERVRVLEVGLDGDVAVERAGDPDAGGIHGWLAVMRGCDLNCTFCIVPRVRGRVLSRPVAEVVREARWMVARGARAITLLGQTVNSYGEDLPEPGPGEPRGRGRDGRPALADLLYALEELEGLARVRLVTLHPAYVTPALAEALRDCPRVERFLPLPLQSGCDAVLRAMRRGYSVDLYRRKLELLRRTVPGIELGSDWIVGFPGETRAAFERSLALAEELGFAQGYVFKYDPRPGTAADALSDDVPAAEKARRNQELLCAVERSARRRLQSYVGTTQHALAEELHERRAGAVRGRTRHGIAVAWPGGAAGLGREHAVLIAQASAYGLAGDPATLAG
jgi:tRNA-2-methylthio-N6-dimethylallyladenosine synthase